MLHSLYTRVAVVSFHNHMTQCHDKFAHYFSIQSRVVNNQHLNFSFSSTHYIIGYCSIDSASETAHALCHASHMMWGECGYSRIDLESYG
jgi:hypothetical protein